MALLLLVLALMTMAAIFAVLLPLRRSNAPPSEGNEAAVYKDQLAEVEADLASGLIGATEAAAARIEISRRLLAVSQPSSPSGKNSQFWRRAVTVMALVGLPLVAVAVYAPLGSPDLPDSPLAGRDRVTEIGGSLEAMVAKVEQHLAQNPADGRGWAVLAPVLGRLGRHDDAVRAWRKALALNGDNAVTRTDLAIAMVAAAKGVITEEAKAEFARAHAADAGELRATYFLGLAAEQDGRKDEAATIWSAINGAGWAELAPVLGQMGRREDAVRASRNALAANGDSAEARAELGLAMVAAAEGRVSAEAKAEFERAHALDADEPRANYFLGVAAEQAGRKDDAATIWRAMLEKAPKDAPWRKVVRAALVRVGALAATDEDKAQGRAADEQTSEADREAVIRGMVDRLAKRLRENGDDLEGWGRLVRAYVVMGERDKARAALEDARRAMHNDPVRLEKLNEGLRDLGLDG